jgi:hypothetical protein
MIKNLQLQALVVLSLTHLWFVIGIHGIAMPRGIMFLSVHWLLDLKDLLKFKWMVSKFLCLVLIACRKWTSSDGEAVKKQPRDMAWSTDVAVFITPIEESANFQQISSSSFASVHPSPTWSPDSKKVAFLSMSHPQYESHRLQLAVFDIETQQLTYPTRDLDLSFSSLLWAPQDSTSTIPTLFMRLLNTEAQFRSRDWFSTVRTPL